MTDANTCFQSFGGRPAVFVTAKYSRSTKPNDAIYVWLENVESRGFELCIREFLPFDGKHQDTNVVSQQVLIEGALVNDVFALFTYYLMLSKALT